MGVQHLVDAFLEHLQEEGLMIPVLMYVVAVMALSGHWKHSILMVVCKTIHRMMYY